MVAGRGRRAIVVVAVAMSSTGLFGCGGSDETTAPSTAAPSTTSTIASEASRARPYPVRTVTEPFEDASRPTPATGLGPESASRLLPTIVTLPDAEGSFPLVVLAHGLGGDPTRYEQLASAWAAQGLVVARPRFPATNSSVPDSEAHLGDVQQQPADISFVIDQLLAESSRQGAGLSGRIDPDHIGVAGHSLGSAAAFGVTFAPCCRDARIDATMIFAGVRLVEPGQERFDLATPTIVFHGDADATLPYGLSVDSFARMSTPKWFVTLSGAGHSPPFNDEQSAWDEIVERSTIDFWEAELQGDPAALDRLGTDAVATGLSSLQTG